MSNSPVAFSAAAAATRANGAPPSARMVAELQVHAPPKKGATELGPLLHTIPFQFNPNELTLTKAASWEPGRQRNSTKVGPAEYKHSQPCTLTLEVFLDATDTMDSSVVTRVEKLFGCLVKSDEADKSPPWVVFAWGGLTGFTAYVSNVSATYTVFTPAGLPVRAVCSVVLDEISGVLPKQNPTSGSVATSRARTVVAGDCLAGIAYAEYGDPALWRAVAEFNGIDDPLRLVPGARVQLPPIEELGARRDH